MLGIYREIFQGQQQQLFLMSQEGLTGAERPTLLVHLKASSLLFKHWKSMNDFKLKGISVKAISDTTAFRNLIILMLIYMKHPLERGRWRIKSRTSTMWTCKMGRRKIWCLLFFINKQLWILSKNELILSPVDCSTLAANKEHKFNLSRPSPQVWMMWMKTCDGSFSVCQ